tara:strand:+ start:249 stop:440 length:192 start_codon:yes stop_codon:yes gene_type:complete
MFIEYRSDIIIQNELKYFKDFDKHHDIENYDYEDRNSLLYSNEIEDYLDISELINLFNAMKIN